MATFHNFKLILQHRTENQARFLQYHRWELRGNSNLFIPASNINVTCILSPNYFEWFHKILTLAKHLFGATVHSLIVAAARNVAALTQHASRVVSLFFIENFWYSRIKPLSSIKNHNITVKIVRIHFVFCDRTYSTTKSHTQNYDLRHIRDVIKQHADDKQLFYMVPGFLNFIVEIRCKPDNGNNGNGQKHSE